jgi:hypothetical protein
MAGNNRAAPFLMGAGAGVLGTLLLKVKEARAAAPENTQQMWDMITALIESQGQLTASIDSLVATMGGNPSGGADPFENTIRFTTGQVICTALNQGFQLPSILVPKNKQVAVKGLPGNIGWVLVAATQGDSQNLVVAYPLVPNEGIGLYVKNTDRIWVMAPAPPMGALNDGVAFIGRSLFRATVDLPVNVPIGRYTANVYLFRDGQIVSKNQSTLEVSKAGFERMIYLLAFNHPLIYGLLAVALAMLAGLAGWAAFRRE